MARYKFIDTCPQFTSVNLQRQLVFGTIEHASDYLVYHRIDSLDSMPAIATTPSAPPSTRFGDEVTVTIPWVEGRHH